VEDMFLLKTLNAKIKPEEESAKIREMGEEGKGTREVGGNGIMTYVWPNRFGTSTMEDTRMSRWEQEGYL
jgi:hypothetical protein